MILELITASGLPAIKTVSVSVSAEEAVRTAALDCVIVGSGVPVEIGQEVTLAAGGEPVLTGYVRDIGTGYGADTRNLTLSLVSKTVDFVECSAEHATGEWLDKDLGEIADELDTLGIGVETDGSSFPKEPRHKLVVGESPYSTIERRARGRGVLIYDTPKGRIKLATKPEGTHAGTLRRGENILPGATAQFTERGRHSEVKVRGQASGGTEKEALRPETIARDSSLRRRRPVILRLEGETTVDRMKKRAEWQANRAAGNAVTANLPVTGWRDVGGKIWSPNWLVRVEDDWLGLEGLMIIKAVELTQSDEGTKAILSLADPRALGGDNPRGKSAGGYGAPGAIEAEYQDE